MGNCDFAKNNQEIPGTINDWKRWLWKSKLTIIIIFIIYNL